MLQPTYAPRRSRGRRRKLRTWPIVVLLAAPLTYLFVWRTPTSAPIGIDSASATIPDMEEERGPTAAAATASVDESPPLPADAPPPPPVARRPPVAESEASPPPPPPPPPPDDAACAGFEVRPDTDLPMGDLRDHADGAHSLAECCELCEQQRQRHSKSGGTVARNSAAQFWRTSAHFSDGRSVPATGRACVGLTYVRSANECWLKADVDSGPAPQRGLVSAVWKAAAGGTAHGAATAAAVAAAGPPPPPRPEGGGVGGMASPAAVVMTHTRADMLSRCLDQLFAQPLVSHFAVYVSEDGGSAQVRQTAAKFAGVREVLHHPSGGSGKTFDQSGFAKIAKHFRLALDAVLGESTRAHSHAIFIEDDLLLAPDFLLLFASAAPLLRTDPTLWCVSAWHDQGFPHVATDPKRLLRTDYFPGLGWMIGADTWNAELKPKWPTRATTGWDHWMRLSSTSHGRECVVPEVPRSRHKPGKQGNTNVRDNRPFERFAFERNGVDDFGDLSYLKRDAYDAEIRSLFDGATLVRPPSTRGADGAVGWLTNLPAGSHLLPYIREEYQNYAKPLGLWAESPRATHNGTLVLRTANGATFLFADRRRSPWLPAAERRRPPRGGREVVAAPGASCADACKEGGGRCETPELEWVNDCDALARHFPCEAGCGHQVGSELPAYAHQASLDTHRQCLVSDIAFSKCEAKFAKTTRLCFCLF